MEAREPGQVRKEAALSGHLQAHRGCRTGVTHRTAPRAATSEEGARSTFAVPRGTAKGIRELRLDVLRRELRQPQLVA